MKTPIDDAGVVGDANELLIEADRRWRDSRVMTAKMPGFVINPGTLDDYLDLVSAAVDQRRKVRLFNYNLHSLYQYYRSAELRRHYGGSIAFIDGMPLVALLRLAGYDVGRQHRLTYVDFIWPLLERASEEGRRVFFIGQHEEVLEAGLQRIRQRLPDLAVGGHHGYFDQMARGNESLAVVDAVNAFGADILLVGLGTPAQERWVCEHADLLDVPAMLVCGACMEYIAGKVRTPPRWMGRWGLEWSFRLLENPRRFAHRYLVEPWVLAAYLLKNLVSGSRV